MPNTNNPIAEQYTVSASVAKLEIQNKAMHEQLEDIHTTFQKASNRAEIEEATSIVGRKILSYMDMKRAEYIEVLKFNEQY